MGKTKTLTASWVDDSVSLTVHPAVPHRLGRVLAAHDDLVRALGAKMGYKTYELVPSKSKTLGEHLAHLLELNACPINSVLQQLETIAQEDKGLAQAACEVTSVLLDVLQEYGVQVHRQSGGPMGESQ